MKLNPPHIVLLGLSCFLPTILLAQSGTDPFFNSRSNYGILQLRVVAGLVTNPAGEPIVRAEIEIQNNAGDPARYIRTDANGRFQSNYEFMWDNSEVRHFVATLKFSKKGFRTTHKFWDVPSTKISPMLITMYPVQPEDSRFLSEADLIKTIGPRLRQLGPADGLMGQGEKEYAKGVQEFLDRNHLDQAMPYFYKVVKDSPQCLRCRTMLGLAEMSWGDWDDAQHEIGDLVNAFIKDKDHVPGIFEALFIEGTFSSWTDDAKTGAIYLKEATKFAPIDPVVLQELARLQALNLDWLAASDSLNKALAAGAGPEARLMLAEALCWAGTPSQAEAEFIRYLDGRNLKSASPKARSIWEDINKRKKDESAVVAFRAKAENRGEEPVDYLNSPPIANLPDFKPATDQAPLAGILEAVGKNVAELFTNLPNVSSVETVRQEILSRKGKPVSAQECKYRYLLGPPDKRWGITVEEYRTDSRGHQTPQLGASASYMLTSGFVSAPLVFYPPYQAGSAFRLAGTQILKGRETFLVAYAQQPAKARNYGSFQQGNQTTLIYSQGMAWIDSENYQIVRLKTDLLRPSPLIKLNKVTTEIALSEVQFKKPSVKFWLPDDVMVTLNWNGRFLRNKHAYSEFLVFNVDSSQRIAAPKNAEKLSNEEPGKSILPSARPLSHANAFVKP